MAYTVKPVFMRNQYLTTQEVLPLQQMEPYGMGELGSWWNPGSWSWLTGSEHLKDPWGTSGETTKSGGLFSWFKNILSGGTTYKTEITLKTGEKFTGRFVKGSDGLWHNLKDDGSYGAFSWGENAIASFGSGGGRVDQGWLAKVFGVVGGGAQAIIKLAQGLYSIAGEKKTYAELTPEQQQQVTQAENKGWQVGQAMIPGVSNTVLIIGVGVLILFAFMMSRGKQQQPIIIGGQ